jgi:UDP-glucose 4-epimerase
MAATYLVTGGSGFIGSYLVEALLARGGTVTVLDDLSTGDLANLQSVQENRRFRFVHGSILDRPLVDELVQQADVVVHLAAAVGVRLIVENPLRSLVTNIDGSQNVIGAAHRFGRKILVASTSEIYGKNTQVPLTEAADRILGDPGVARWSYSTAKAVDEILANCYHREHGLQSIVVRLFNTVGPRQSPAYGMVIPRFVRQALAGEPLTVYGDGGQKRCFVHVADVVDALLRLMDTEAAVGLTFNVGSQEEITILDLARRIAGKCQSDSEVVLVPYTQAYGEGFEDMPRRVPDTTRLRTLTGWAPRFRLDDVLDDTLREVRRSLPQPADLVAT